MSAARSAMPEMLRAAALELPGPTVHYVECGSGRPIVLLHGYTDSWHSFRLVVPALADYGRCLAFDQRGHGCTVYEGDDFSMDAFAADAAEFIDTLQLGPVTLIGHSMGSLIARKVALVRPALVERLVLLGAPLRFNNAAVRKLQAELAGFDSVIPHPFVEAFQASCIHDRAAVPEWFFNACVDASAAVLPRVWRGALAGFMDNGDDNARLGEIRCPVPVLGGRLDAIFPPLEQTALAQAFSRGTLLLYDDVGHSPHWEAPERFVADAAAFHTAAG